MLKEIPIDTVILNIEIKEGVTIYSLSGSGLEIDFRSTDNLQNIKRVNIINKGDKKINPNNEKKISKKRIIFLEPSV